MPDRFEDSQAPARAFARPQPERDCAARPFGCGVMLRDQLGLALRDFRKASLQGLGNRAVVLATPA
jgi:hypothetical protein